MAPTPTPTPGIDGNVPAPLTLTPALLAKFKPAKIFKTAVEPAPAPSPAHSPKGQNNGPRHITGISFDDRGDQVVTAAEDETFRLYSCKTGKQLKVLYSKKYGVDLPRFTHKNTAIVHASTKEDDTVRYHSLHDNKYLQYFKGHKDKVISLEVSPVDDGFMSGSMDKTVRLWDLRTPTCRGLLNLPSTPIVAYDASGLVFAVAVNHYSRILLYDQANFDKAPFLVITLEDSSLALVQFPPRAPYITSLSFSSNGKHLLVGCSGDAHYVLDAFEGHLLAKLEGHTGLERRKMGAPLHIEPQRGSSGEEVSWTPDSKFVVSGSLNGNICIWDLQNLPTKTGAVDLKAKPLSLQPMTTLEGHPGPSRCVKFNPRLAMMCTAGSELAFWLPDMSGDLDEIAKELLRKKSQQQPPATGTPTPAAA
ncbi:WD40-repeat-containing domain protein [Abortiporus biennis]|nr:WD40-repeat-containing domain protein [Abortiporus biennis]